MSTPTAHRPLPSRPAGWWRRNRWALAALPVVLALTLVAAGDRVRTLWWEQDLRVPTTVGGGHDRSTSTSGSTTAYGGTLPIDVQVHLDGVGDATTLPEDMELPDGTRAVQVDLTLSADPDVVLTGCSLAVRDAAGTRYDYVSNAWGALQAVVPCVPEDTPGSVAVAGRPRRRAQRPGRPAPPGHVVRLPGGRRPRRRRGHRRGAVVAEAAVPAARGAGARPRVATGSGAAAAAWPARIRSTPAASSAIVTVSPTAVATDDTMGANASHVSTSCGPLDRPAEQQDPLLEPRRGEEREREHEHRPEPGDREPAQPVGEGREAAPHVTDDGRGGLGGPPTHRRGHPLPRGQAHARLARRAAPRACARRRPRRR